MKPDALDARIRKLASSAGFSFHRHESLPGDVGNRRYSRLFGKDKRTVIAVVYPPGEDGARRRWLRVREALEPRVRVPRLLADDGKGAQILEDFGDTPLSLAWRGAPPALRRRLSRDAARVAAAIAGTADPGANPPFTADYFRTEMEKSRESVFGAAARLPMSDEEEAVHDVFARSLAAEVSAHPRLFLHRDFHADNLLLVGGEIGVIDFQDARLGPDTYDLASLTRERATLLEFDASAEDAAVRAFRAERAPPPGFRRRMRRVRLQRAWKAAGTFAAVLGRRRGPQARRYLSAELRMVLELLGNTGAEAEFRRILTRRSAKLLSSAKEAKC